MVGIGETGGPVKLGSYNPLQLTTAERLAIEPFNGLLVYDTTLQAFFSYQNGAWLPVDLSAKVKFTPEGGLAIKLTNKTGAPSVKGYVVTVGATANSVKLVPIDEPNAIGVIYDAGVADAAEVWVVVSGIADVYFIGNTSIGNIARTGLTADAGEVAGQALAEAYPTSPFATDKHFCEIGHVLEARVGAGLAKCVLHFN